MRADVVAFLFVCAVFSARYGASGLERNWNAYERSQVETLKDSSRFLQSQVSRSVYCREGSLGACRAHQVFVEMTDSAYIPADADFALVTSTDCFTEELPASDIGRRSSITAKGICVWDYPKAQSGESEIEIPCSGYPASYMYLKEASRCLSELDALNFCLRKRQRFYLDNDKVGACDCDIESELYWHPMDTCYRINSKGPCRDGEWLALNSSGEPECRSTSCPANGHFVLHNNPYNDTVGCYRLGSPELCVPARRQVLKRIQRFPEVIGCAGSSSDVLEIAKARLRTCAPGTKLSIHGHCRTTISE